MRRLVCRRWSCLAVGAFAVAVLLPAAALIGRAPLLLQPTQVAVGGTPTAVALPTWTHVPPPPTIAPKDLSLRLTSLWSGIRFFSLNERAVFDALHPDLSRYHFPSGYPLLIAGDQLFLQVSVDGETVDVKTLITRKTLTDYCTPSPDLDRLLCALSNVNHIDHSWLKGEFAESEKRERVQQATNAYLEGNLRKDYFVFLLPEEEILVIPQPVNPPWQFTYNSRCRWSTNDIVSCLLGNRGGEQVETVDPAGAAVPSGSRSMSPRAQLLAFSVAERSYLSLPEQGQYVYDHPLFRQGFIQALPGNSPDYSLNLYIYSNHGKELRQASGVLTYSPVADDAIIYFDLCESDRLCFHYVQVGEDAIRRQVDIQLGPGRAENRTPCAVYFGTAVESYLLTACDRVYMVDKDNLRLGQVLEMGGHVGALSYAVYATRQILITSDYRWPSSPGSYEASGMTLYRLGRCRGALDDSCVGRSWSVNSPPETPFGGAAYRRLWFWPWFDENRILMADENAQTLTIYPLESDEFKRVQLPIKPTNLVGIDQKGYLLLADMGNVIRVPADVKALSLVDDIRGDIVPVEIVPNENLLLVLDAV